METLLFIVVLGIVFGVTFSIVWTYVQKKRKDKGR